VSSGGPTWIASACGLNGIARGASDAGAVMHAIAAGKRVLWAVADDWEAEATDAVVRLAAHDRSLQPLADALADRRIPGATLWFDDEEAALRVTVSAPRRSLRDSFRRATGRQAPRVPLAATLARMAR